MRDDLERLVLRWRVDREPHLLAEIWVDIAPLLEERRARYLSIRYATEENVTAAMIEGFMIALALRAFDTWDAERTKLLTHLYSEWRRTGRYVLHLANRARVARGERRIPETEAR